MHGASSYSGFTHGTLASLIIFDRWLKHVKLRLVDANPNMDNKTKGLPCGGDGQS